jgi:hypothetical protein
MEEVYLIRILKSVLSVVALLQFITKIREGKAMVQTPKWPAQLLPVFSGSPTIALLSSWVRAAILDPKRTGLYSSIGSAKAIKVSRS